LRTFIRALLRWIILAVDAVGGRTSVGHYIYGQIIGIALDRTAIVDHNGVILQFHIPNAINRFRTNTFSTKEPETLSWIDKIPNGSVLWDIGANVGLYTCYAAVAKHCRVLAFEPSIFNLEMLTRNVFLNESTGLVTIIPLPLSDNTSINRLNMTSTEWGGACSTFGESYGYDGKPLAKKFEFSTMGISIDDAIRLLGLLPPDFIKMDVDGIEHLILKGGVDALRHVQGVLIEINDDFPLQSENAARYLLAAGLVLQDKRHCEAAIGSPFAATCNQIWGRGRG